MRRLRRQASRRWRCCSPPASLERSSIAAQLRAESALATGSGLGAAEAVVRITEPDAGSNSHRISTTARGDGDRYILNGQKTYISGVESADWIMVVARTSTDEASGRGRLSVFMVDASAPGLSRTKIRTVMNMPEGSWQLFFDDVEVPADQLIGEQDRGLAVAFTGR